MATDTPKSTARPIPVARPARPGLAVATAPEPDPGPPEVITPGAVTGWAWSLGLHAMLLVGMALWYFVPRDNGPRTIDARLAGNEFGLIDGLELHGGLDTPIGPDEGMLADPLQATPLEGAAEIVALPDVAQLAGPRSAEAGGGQDRGNPGIGDGQGFGIARFGQGGESIRGVEVKVGDPQFTLIWDTEVDLDLHVLEPGGSEIWWDSRNGQRGGELDVDDIDGLGPENVYWLTDTADGDRVKGRGPAGEYRWYVEYYGGFGGIPKPTSWKVRVKHAGRVDVYSGRLTRIKERSKTFTLKFEEARPAKPVDRLLEGVLGDRDRSR